jgi:hypothetical protein
VLQHLSAHDLVPLHRFVDCRACLKPTMLLARDSSRPAGSSAGFTGAVIGQTIDAFRPPLVKNVVHPGHVVIKD